MEKWLFAGVLFLGILFLNLQIKRESNQLCVRPVAATASLTERKPPTDTAHKLTLLSNELKGHTCVLPRQTSGQGVHHIANKRTLRGLEKVLQQFRLRGENQLRKVSEIISDCQILNYFTLLCRRGYYIFTLRKLLI
ncbi:MAG: hypothetical protein LBP98_06535 [Tannerella sp.]|jgi:hypothetical protein|nr:hypothetical protein [Tannerella sp.]